MTLDLRDPTTAPRPRLRAFERIGLAVVNDPRDLPFVGLCAEITLGLVPLAALLYVPHLFRWWLAPIYYAIWGLVFLDRYILMLHNTSHRRLFNARFALLNQFIPRVLGPFFGETPDTYFAHHVGMHHVENNLPGDLSSTMPYQRDSLWDFLRYYGRFIAVGIVELTAYFRRLGRRELFRRTLWGELLAWALYGLLAFVDWRATLVVFVVPLFLARFLMMAGNWGQHAFVAASDPGSDYLNSISCINTRYNRRCFNDGYHIGHHVKPTRHWTELPEDLRANVADYARRGALVFDGVDFFQVWLFLMLKRYRALGRRRVHLGDGPAPSLDETVALLRERTRRFAAHP